MKKRFFEPFVGNEYQKEINGKKILVLGASFYCNKDKCKYFDKCTNVEAKDSSYYDCRCPEYAGTDRKLHQEPANCLQDAPRTYTIFTNYMSQLMGGENYENVWRHLAFTNYVQFFLPSSSEAYRPTLASDLSERDFDAFNETLVELQPDIVIAWGCVFSSRLKEQNEYLVDRGELDRSEWYVCHVKVPGVSHEVAIINSYHPSSSKWHSNITTFDKYLKQELRK